MHEQSIVESLLSLALQDAEKANVRRIISIKPVEGDPQKQKAFIIKDKCKGCGLCIITCKPNAMTYIIVRPPEGADKDQPKPEFPV